MRYDASQKSKPGSLFLIITPEHTGSAVTIHCSSITVSDED